MIDLHSHTVASDGTDTPAQLVELALTTGLRALAITDHDTMDGLSEAATRAAGTPLRVIYGIELSTRLLSEPDPVFRNAHLLGYFFRPAPTDFLNWLEVLRQGRRRRNEAMAEKLREIGLEITLKEAEAHGRNITGRPHFARVLCNKGYCSSQQEAFRLYLGETGAAYVERESPALEEGIERLRSAGAIPVMAHPVRTCPPDRDARRLLTQWRDLGLAGAELWHPDHNDAARTAYAPLFDELGLIATGGSDYHGGNKPGIRLGWGRGGEAVVEDSVLDQLERHAAHGQ